MIKSDFKSPLCFVGIATIINVILDIILVGPFEMGTAGAAYATITAQGISFVMSLLYLQRRKVFFSAAEHGKFTLQWGKLTAIIKVGLPTAIQMVVVNTAYLLVTGMLNQFGTSSIGAGAANVAMFNALLDAVIIRLPVLPAIVGLLYFKNRKWEQKS